MWFVRQKSAVVAVPTYASHMLEEVDANQTLDRLDNLVARAPKETTTVCVLNSSRLRGCLTKNCFATLPGACRLCFLAGNLIVGRASLAANHGHMENAFGPSVTRLAHGRAD